MLKNYNSFGFSKHRTSGKTSKSPKIRLSIKLMAEKKIVKSKYYSMRDSITELMKEK